MHVHHEDHVRTIANVRVGEPDINPDAPAHTPGIREGNRTRPLERKRGLDEKDIWYGRATPERSTGINPRKRAPIDPRMPVLTPA